MTQTLTPSNAIRNVHRTVLDNGIVLLVTQNPAADIVATRYFYAQEADGNPKKKQDYPIY